MASFFSILQRRSLFAPAISSFLTQRRDHEFNELHQEQSDMKDDNQRFLACDRKTKKQRGSLSKLSVSFQSTKPQQVFLQPPNTNRHSQHHHPKGSAKTVSVQETNIWWAEENDHRGCVLQWPGTYPTKPHRPLTFSCCLGLCAEILP